jgi:DNA-binding response OmpR family regulator
LFADRRILVIDDNPSVLLAVSKVLTRRGAAVTSAGGVAEAIRILAVIKEKFDMVLTDLRMPLTSGKLILSLENGICPGVPVIIMSAFWTDETKNECLDLGATRCLDKPLSSRELLAAIAEELDRAANDISPPNDGS